jgi:uncharacterized membrane protein (UPF0182 family)
VLAKGADYYLDRFDLVTKSGSLITGMSYTDDHAVLPAKNILMAIAVICAILFFLNVWRRTWMLPSVGLALLALSAVLLGLIWPGIVQQFQVKPSEADKEAPYIRSNIEATRVAYNVSDVKIEPYTSNVNLTGASLGSLDDQTASAPLVDPQLVRAVFEQNPQVRAFYSVAPVLDVDRYQIDANDRALVLGVRELDQNGINDSDKNWSNLHTVYTHGNGIIAAYANQRPKDDSVQLNTQTQGSDSVGIEWAEGNGPGQDDLTEVTGGFEDRVYYGELSPNYSIVGKASPDATDVELNLPTNGSDEAATTTYDGKGDVQIGGFFDKLMYAVKFGDSNFLLSERVNSNSKVLYNRNPRDRVEKVAPWLSIDSDPYPAVVDGKILWILDGYTTTDRFPQAEKNSFKEMTDDSLQTNTDLRTLPTDEINYMRNAVKATVDAYDGTVTLYAWDETDPILQAWRSAFPGTVKDKAEIPPELRDHLRYPEDLFKVQRYQFARYHVTDPGDFYQGNNRWEVPEDPYAPGSLQPPYRLFVDDPGVSGNDEVFSLSSVFVPFGKSNLASFVSVNADATSDSYGTMRVLELPNEQTPGPGQVANTFASDPDVADALAQFNRSGARPVYGNLLTLPVSDALMYIQPVYATRELSDSSFPILTYVLVKYGDDVGIGTTLRESLANLLGVSGGTTPPPGGGNPGGGNGNPAGNGSINNQIRSLLAKAEAAFNAADAALAETPPDTVTWAAQTQAGRDFIARAYALAQQRNGSGNPSSTPSSTATPNPTGSPSASATP